MAGAIVAIAESPEARAFAEGEAVAETSPDGVFIQKAYEVLLGRGAMVDELAFWQHKLTTTTQTRKDLVFSLFKSNPVLLPTPKAELGGTTRSYILGTEQFVDVDQWRARDVGAEELYENTGPKAYTSRFELKKGSELLVTAIASLYRGANYIERFLENITSQSIFETNCELIVIDANSPDGEAAVIERYMEKFDNIRYYRCSKRIGIYEAWNLGVSHARGKYITNTNLDDLRRCDSFEIQAATLENLPFADIVYQDVFYSFDAGLSYEEVARHRTKSNVPIITPYNLLRFNSPHNAPMWRRGIHDDIGLFDARYESAGDCDFWMRCVQGGRIFYKINDPHVIYYVNPDGISTRPNTRGVDEWFQITKAHSRNMISENLTSFPMDFVTKVGEIADQTVEPFPDIGTQDWRYAFVQSGLRNLSRLSRAQDPSWPGPPRESSL